MLRSETCELRKTMHPMMGRVEHSEVRADVSNEHGDILICDGVTSGLSYDIFSSNVM